MGGPAPSLHRESTDSLIIIQVVVYTEFQGSLKDTCMREERGNTFKWRSINRVSRFTEGHMYIYIYANII